MAKAGRGIPQVEKYRVMLPDPIDAEHLRSVASQAAPALTEFAFLREGRLWLWPDMAGTSLFHLGSITKPFTALLLAQMIDADEIAPDATVGDHLPAARGSADVRLFELATHTSGLPLLPEPIAAAGERCPEDPSSAVTIDDMVEAARCAHPGPTRGSYEYSNFGYALLGLVLATAAGHPFEDLLTHRVLDPLGLRDTVFDIHDDPRLVEGHYFDGAPVAHCHHPAMQGGGALLATVADLGRHLTAQLRPDATPLRSAIRRTHELRIRRPTGWQAGALAWTIDDVEGIHRYWHSGATPGFSAYAAFVPATETGLAIVRSRAPVGPGELQGLGNTLLDRLAS
jgi:D-alanyl-D-alanine-carboxypeptidase/D-alanyl-D-alanine-endopeptidase